MAKRVNLCIASAELGSGSISLAIAKRNERVVRIAEERGNVVGAVLIQIATTRRFLMAKLMNLCIASTELACWVIRARTAHGLVERRRSAVASHRHGTIAVIREHAGFTSITGVTLVASVALVTSVTFITLVALQGRKPCSGVTFKPSLDRQFVGTLTISTGNASVTLDTLVALQGSEPCSGVALEPGRDRQFVSALTIGTGIAVNAVHENAHGVTVTNDLESGGFHRLHRARGTVFTGIALVTLGALVALFTLITLVALLAVFAIFTILDGADAFVTANDVEARAVLERLRDTAGAVCTRSTVLAVFTCTSHQRKTRCEANCVCPFFNSHTNSLF